MFTDTVYIEKDTVLVQANLPLRQKEIDLLTRWEVEEVFTEGEIIARAPTRSEGYSAATLKSTNLYLSAVERLDGIFTDAGKNEIVDHNRIDGIVTDVLAAIDEDQDEIIQYVIVGGENINKLADNSIKNAILSSIIGKGLKLLQFKLIQLSTGALLHDIGMLKVPEVITGKKGKLTAAEIKQIQSHTLHGYSIVSKLLQYPDEVAMIALLHQENWDGTGYPRGLKGKTIPLASRIVAVADAFEAMVNRRSYRSRVVGYSAIKAILSDNGRQFDPNVVKALIMSIGIHPVGSLVMLNNASVGRVVGSHHESPLRPVVKLLYDEYGGRLAKEEIVDLLEEKDLFISKALDLEEMEGL
jgi:HD-GYP domain-containing protein (c-di-GMP phosphodiesterase class II)